MDTQISTIDLSGIDATPPLTIIGLRIEGTMLILETSEETHTVDLASIGSCSGLGTALSNAGGIQLGDK